MFDPCDRDLFPATAQLKGTDMNDFMPWHLTSYFQKCDEQREERNKKPDHTQGAATLARNPMISRTFESAYGKQKKEEK
jgi:hypothetical protein